MNAMHARARQNTKKKASSIGWTYPPIAAATPSATQRRPLQLLQPLHVVAVEDGRGGQAARAAWALALAGKCAGRAEHVVLRQGREAGPS
eukprot:3910746-Pleurochrysis_carterae.AAC.1